MSNSKLEKDRASEATLLMNIFVMFSYTAGDILKLCPWAVPGASYLLLGEDSFHLIAAVR